MSIPTVLEEPRATWDKRYKQKHYGYRDFQRATTLVLTRLQMLLTPAASYIFGTNARTIAPANWPTNCYAREILVYCTQNAWITIVSANPAYIRLRSQGYTATEIANMGVSTTLIEAETYIRAGDYFTFYPTLGASVFFRADTVSGTIHFWIEGNVEGTD